MVDEEIIQEWIDKADTDFDFARINLEEEKPFFSQICFHFSQSAEKYLKAYILAKGLQFRKIHDLVMLLNQCCQNDPAFDTLNDDCEYLSVFYIETRYPVHWPTNFSITESQKAYRAAEKIRKFIKEKLR